MSVYCHCHGHYVLRQNMLLSQVCRSVTECAKVRQITTQCAKVTMTPLMAAEVNEIKDAEVR